jgi:hypothetical protein
MGNETNLKKRIRPILVQEALEGPEILDQDIDDRTEDLVEEPLAEFLDD